MSGASPDLGYLPKTRVEAFSDGVVAIIVTVLALEIKVPRLEGDRLEDQLLAALWHALPLVGAYVVSFMVLLVFRVAHQQLMHSLRRVDRNLRWLNGLFPTIPAFVPAPTALIGEYPNAVAGSVLYGVVLEMAGLSLAAMRVYITRHGALLHEAIPAAAARQAVRTGLLSPILYGLAAALTLVDTRLALGVYVIVPLINILPGAFDRMPHQSRE
jgi:uncharacterized membrane protein